MPGGFTGDGSVGWFSTDSSGVLAGTDSSPRGGRFYITIQWPQEPAEKTKLMNDLAAAAKGTGTDVTLDFPIEDTDWEAKTGKTKRPGKDTSKHDHFQIYVDWKP